MHQELLASGARLGLLNWPPEPRIRHLLYVYHALLSPTGVGTSRDELPDNTFMEACVATTLDYATDVSYATTHNDFHFHLRDDDNPFLNLQRPVDVGNLVGYLPHMLMKSMRYRGPWSESSVSLNVASV